jgi:hypothetical protein
MTASSADFGLRCTDALPYRLKSARCAVARVLRGGLGFWPDKSNVLFLARTRRSPAISGDGIAIPQASAK